MMVQEKDMASFHLSWESLRYPCNSFLGRRGVYSLCRKMHSIQNIISNDFSTIHYKTSYAVIALNSASMSAVEPPRDPSQTGL